MERYLAEQVQRMGSDAGGTRRELDGAVPPAPGLVQRAEQQTGAPQRVIGRAESGDVAPRRVPFEERRAFSKPSHSLARLAELRQHPGGLGEREGKQDIDVADPIHRDRSADQGGAFAQSPVSPLRTPAWL